MTPFQETYFGDNQWLHGQLQKRHPSLKKKEILKLLNDNMTIALEWCNIHDEVDSRKYPTETDRVMDRRMRYLLAVEKIADLKSPYESE